MIPESPNLDEALDWLYSTQLFGIKLGLEGITRLLAACGTLYPHSRVLHVAGTNGKGSTCAFAESIARAAGYSTGLFTSPHLVEFNERIRVNGRNIANDDAARLINRIRALIETWETKPTFFEIVLAVAMLYFAEREVDLIILETGMGGRLDATNAVPKDVAALTPIGLDHTQYLGNTLSQIAAEKGAIIAWHRPSVSAPQHPEAWKAIDACARAKDTECRLVNTPCNYPLGLAGAHQKYNAALAIAALQSLPGFLCSEEELKQGLAHVNWPGRFEEVKPGVIMDGAHNPHAMKVLVQTWRQTYGEKKACCLYAGAKDKALDETLHLLAPIVREWILPPVQSPRILAPQETKRKVQAVSQAPVSTPSTLAQAMELLRPEALICGSFFLLGEAKAHLRNHSCYRTTQQ